MPFRLPKPGRKTSVVLGLLVVLGLAVAAFDWNWLRHPLENFLSEASRREVKIGHLGVDLAFSLEPTVHVQDLYIENAPWADKRPFAVAREASITFSLKSVWEKRPVISRLVLVDAELDMERQADGLRNWRLRNPEDRGPGRVKLLSLEPHRTTIRFVRRDIDFDVTAAASPSQSAADVKAEDTAHPTRIQFKGEFGGTPFAGDVETGQLLTFLTTGQSFPIRGRASAGKTRADVDGIIADLFYPSIIDAKVHIAGPSLSDLRGFFRGSLPASRPYEFETHITQTEADTSFGKVRGTIGRSDLTGDISIARHNGRPTIRATLRSKSADLADLASLFGAHLPAAAATARSDRENGQLEKATAGPPDRALPKRLFPNHVFNGERLKALDAHVSLDVKTLKSAGFPTLESLHVVADLSDGILALNPLKVGVAGGLVAGVVTLDGKQKPLSANAKLDFKDVELEQLLGRLRKGAKSAGPLQGHIDLKGRGDTVAALMASASGSAEFAMQSGGISNLLDAKIGLNGGKILRLMLTGDRAIGINNANASFDFKKGRGQSTAILLDTDQTRTEGSGIVDLRDETVDVLLTPHPKKPGLLSLHRTIRVHGPIRQPRFTLAEKEKEPNS